MDSLARARALRPARLLPGHGPPVDDADAAIAAAAAAVAAAPRRLLEALGDGERSTYELVVAVLGQRSRPLARHSALAGAQAVLERLERADEVASSVGEDGVRRYIAASPPSATRT